MSGTTGAPLNLVLLEPSQSEPEVPINANSEALNAWAADHGGGSSDSSDSGASLTVSDGSTTVDDVIELVFTHGVLTDEGGGTVHYAPPTGGGSSDSGGGELPGTIPDLFFWLDSAAILGSSGFLLPMLKNSCPWFDGLNAIAQFGGSEVSATPLASLNVVTFPGTSDGDYLTAKGMKLTKVTVLAVLKPTGSFSSSPTLVSGASAAFEVGFTSAGKLNLVCSSVALIGNGTTAFTAGTWAQANATYDASSGDFAFKFNRSADGTGNNSQSITGFTDTLGMQKSAATDFYAGDVAELIIYNRVLSPTEISDIEDYLFAKWGVG